MHRKIVYTGEVPLGDDFLNSEKNTMIALGMALKAILGTATIVDGLACTPTGPASMQVIVGPGSIHSLVNVDGTAYGDLASDTTHQIVKQGLSLDNTLLSSPAPSTTGNSINYLIQVEYQDVDTDSAVLPYFNASNPPVAFAGPANTGVSQNTTRKGNCVISVKAGASATTGTQTTPTPDAGFMGLWFVTVANGATSITSGNIHLYTGTGAATGSTAFWSTPFITEKLNDKVSIATGDLRWQPIGGGPGTGRTVLTNATTYHVATTGNDTTGDGSSGTPWATVQHAFNYIADNVDLAGFNVTIQLSDGTYSQNPSLTDQWVGGSPANVTLNGNSVTPSNVVLSMSGANGLSAFGTGVGFTVQNMKLTNSAGHLLQVNYGAQIVAGAGMIFDAATSGIHVFAQGNGIIEFLAGYTISGSAQVHYETFGGGVIAIASQTITLSGTPAFSVAFVYMIGGFINAEGLTFAGTGATGTRYTVSANGAVNTNGGGASYFPGNAGGSTATGGQYL